jgi:hypothetical protein
MKEERVLINNIDASKLYSDIKAHIQEIGLQIIHEDSQEGYWSIRAYKGGTLSAITGSIRDVEIMMTKSGGGYDLTLRTGAWGRDIAIPSLLVSAVSFGAGAIVAGAEVYRAYKFEKNFWEWLNQRLGSFNATMTQPLPIGASTKDCSKCNLPIPADAKFCLHCGMQQS